MPAASAQRRAVLTGTLYALAAGLMWGLVFIAPTLLADYPAALLVVGRYLAFGLIAVGWPTRARAVVATAWPVTDHGATLLWAELAPRLASGDDVEAALDASLKRLELAARDGRLADDYVADLIARYPALKGSFEGWLLEGAQLSAALTGGSLISPGDLACWTILGR